MVSGLNVNIQIGLSVTNCGFYTRHLYIAWGCACVHAYACNFHASARRRMAH